MTIKPYYEQHTALCYVCRCTDHAPPSNHKILTPFDGWVDQPWLCPDPEGASILKLFLACYHECVVWPYHCTPFLGEIPSRLCHLDAAFVASFMSHTFLSSFWCLLTWAGQHTRFHLALTLFLISNLTIRFQVPYPFSFNSWSQKQKKKKGSKTCPQNVNNAPFEHKFDTKAKYISRKEIIQHYLWIIQSL